jgi:hypothetical protein
MRGALELLDFEDASINDMKRMLLQARRALFFWACACACRWRALPVRVTRCRKAAVSSVR